jgi:hypothetical protein
MINLDCHLQFFHELSNNNKIDIMNYQKNKINKVCLMKSILDGWSSAASIQAPIFKL